MNNSKRTSFLVAGGIAVAVALWMLSGLGSNPVDFSINQANSASGQPIRVRVEQVRASNIDREILVSGRTEPNRYVSMRAETDGTVVALGVGRGETVQAGQTVIELDIRDRNARLVEANALIEQRELEFEGAQNLRNQQFTSDVQIAEARARLESARAAREKILLEIKNTTVKAPFNGIIQERRVEIGDYVRAGDAVIDVVDIDPLIIAGEINGAEISDLVLDGEGYAVLVDGTVLQGAIRYLAPVADDNTRTFRVELAVENAEMVRAGLTATLHLAGPRISAHELTPALLTLSDDGTVGVKTVGPGNTVYFYPVEIAGSTENGVLVTGLPDTVNLITVGQGFVIEGQRVEPVNYSALEASTPYERSN